MYVISNSVGTGIGLCVCVFASADMYTCVPGTSATRWSQETESLSWASIPSRRWQPSKPREKTKAQAWGSARPTCGWWASRWTLREQVGFQPLACDLGVLLSSELMAVLSSCFPWSRPWRHRVGLPPGGGGAEGTGRHPWCLCLAGPLRRPLHLRQRWPEEGHHLSAVRRLQEEVRAALGLKGRNTSPFYLEWLLSLIMVIILFIGHFQGSLE